VRGTSFSSYPEPRVDWLSARRLRLVVLALVVAAFYAASLDLAQIDLGRLAIGLPKLAYWATKAWPPDLSELDRLLLRAGETVAMATIGTTFAAILAVPLCIVAARNTTPSRFLYAPTRWILDALRGVDSFVFALIFVAAVGLGPFAGVLGIMLHTAGSTAKLWSEALEASAPEPLDAVRMTGASRLKIISYALVPDVLPSLASIALYMWEFNVRSSTVLGVVGAGGIGQELKNSMDLLLFPRLFTILLIIIAMVTVIDQLSAWLRRRLV
jgi:phosphonate transport system permease protein